MKSLGKLFSENLGIPHKFYVKFFSGLLLEQTWVDFNIQTKGSILKKDQVLSEMYESAENCLNKTFCKIHNQFYKIEQSIFIISYH